MRFKNIILCLTLLAAGASASAQVASSTYSPYSIYGVGDLLRQGTAYTKSMGGVGIATRSNRILNTVNPASLTARDTLSFMMDLGGMSENKIFSQNGMTSASNEVNITNIAVSFPVYGKTAVMVGINPFSNVNYSFSHPVTDPSVIASTGNITYSSTGTGGLYQMFLGAGTKVIGNLSVGAQLDYYFGRIEKSYAMTFSKQDHISIVSAETYQMSAIGGKFGAQYVQTVGKGLDLTIGATYSLGARLQGDATNIKTASSSDTLVSPLNTAKIPGELGVGLSLRKDDKWTGEFNYTYSDWNNSNLNGTDAFRNDGTVSFSTAAKHSFRAGFELVPNRNDIRYFLRRCAYRGGLYYENTYYKMDGNNIDAYGLTLGVTIPVFRGYNGVTLGVDFGKRGSVKGNMTRENYLVFMVGFNLHDIWFVKPRYD